jgi:hypothetical protein
MIIYKELPGFKRPTARGRALVRARALALCGMKVNIKKMSEKASVDKEEVVEEEEREEREEKEKREEREEREG